MSDEQYTTSTFCFWCEFPRLSLGGLGPVKRLLKHSMFGKERLDGRKETRYEAFNF